MTKAPGDKTRDIVMEVIWWHNRAYKHKPEITYADIISRCRIAAIVHCRADCMRRIREVRGWSYPRIGRYFGGMDHTTCIYHIRRKDVSRVVIKNKDQERLGSLKLKRDYYYWRKAISKGSAAMAGSATHGEQSHETA